MAGPDTGTGGFGKYRLIAELGHGGMAEVFLALASGPAGFNKLVVIKQIREQLAEDPEFLAMFLDEARLAARLNHPNVVQTNEVGEDGRRYFIAMEYLEGQPLNRIVQRLGKEGRLTLAMHVRVLIDALAGLHYAHELADYDGTPLEVVHRDASPHNVFVTYAGQVKVVDFGIAKALGSSAETRTGVLKGKVSYMAPEQALGHRVDRRADVFAMGIMLWEALAGRRPFKGQTDVAILQQLVAGELQSPRSVRADIPDQLEAICMKALAYDREQRFATAEAMQRALEAALERLGERPQLRELGELATQAFADERQHLRGLVEAQAAYARSPSDPHLLDATRVGATAGRRHLPRVETPASDPSSLHPTAHGPTRVTNAAGSNGTSSRVLSLASNTAPPARPAGPAKKLIALLVVAGMGIGVTVAALAWPRKPLASAPSSTPSAPTPAPRTVRIESTPAGATITEDDVVLGQTPLTIPMDPDRQSARQLVLSLDGYASQTIHQGPSTQDVRVLVSLVPAAIPAAHSATEVVVTTRSRPPAVLGPTHSAALATSAAKPPPPLDINMNR